MNGERHDALMRQLERFRAYAEDNEREQQLGSLAYAYPQSLGEWLGTAVQITGTASWQAHYALRPLAAQADHERRIAEQGRDLIEAQGPQVSHAGRRSPSWPGGVGCEGKGKVAADEFWQ